MKFSLESRRIVWWVTMCYALPISEFKYISKIGANGAYDVTHVYAVGAQAIWDMFFVAGTCAPLQMACLLLAIAGLKRSFLIAFHTKALVTAAVILVMSALAIIFAQSGADKCALSEDEFTDALVLDLRGHWLANAIFATWCVTASFVYWRFCEGASQGAKSDTGICASQ
jgi:hypothetical protein